MSTLRSHFISGATAIELTTEEAIERLRSEAVGRVCIEVHSYPVAFPVNYIVDETPAGSRIVIRTSPDSPIGTYRGVASLEVDRIDLPAGRAWSVLVRGELTPLAGQPPSEDRRPFVADPRTRWMELTIGPVSGRRFVADACGFAVEWQLEPTARARVADRL
jgi:Pyridoxamine 5'-phosphate oxidase